MASYDLTPKIAHFLDPHLVIPLLEFVAPRNVYNENSLLKMHRNILLGTNMIDSLIETYLDEQLPAEVITRKEQVDSQGKILDEQFNPIAAIFENERVIKNMDSARDRQGNSIAFKFMQQEYDFKIEMLETLYKYTKFQYECGDYRLASTGLYYYRNCAPQDDLNFLSALYGKLAAEILEELNRNPDDEDGDEEWVHAKDDLSKLRAYIDSEPFDSKQELIQHRAWLLHWSLFIHFNTSTGCDEIIEMFLNQQAYLNTIQLICPHLLRYVAVAIISNKDKQKSNLKELVNIVEMERESYNDPIIDVLACLYLDTDLEGAKEKLKECEAVFDNDFFLSGYFEGFRENIRALLLEMLCKLHTRISHETIANRLGMDKGEVAEWIDEFIQAVGKNGPKIDTKSDHIIIMKEEIDFYAKVNERASRRAAILEKEAQKQKNLLDVEGKIEAETQAETEDPKQ